MTCPKCRGEMRQYERSGVTVDQCVECRGIFLDRGELERVMDAEAAWNRNRQGAAPTPPPPAPAPGYPPQSYPPPQTYTQHQPHGYGYGHYGHHKRHKRHHKDSFFGELFD